MKAKMIQGATFGPLTKYLLGSAEQGREGAEIIGGNMLGRTDAALAKEFEDVRSLRGDILKPVIHASLSLVPGEVLPAGVSQHEVCESFLKELGIDVDKHPWVGVEHADRAHRHFHIVLCKVADDATVWDRKNYVNKALSATPRLEQRFGLIATKPYEQPANTRAPSRGEREIATRAIDGLSPKLRLQAAIPAALEARPSPGEFERRLGQVGITARLNLASTGKVSGYSFSSGGIAFKGSQLGKSFGWAALSQKLTLDLGQGEGAPPVAAEPPLTHLVKSHPFVPEHIAARSAPEASPPADLRGSESPVHADLPATAHSRGGASFGQVSPLNRGVRGLPQIAGAQDEVRPGWNSPAQPVEEKTVTPRRTFMDFEPGRSSAGPRPDGKLIDSFGSKWVVQTRSEVIFSDAGVNDVAISKGFLAAAASYGPRLHLRDFDPALRARAVEIIARSARLSAVTFDRKEDQDLLDDARGRVEAQAKAESHRRARVRGERILKEGRADQLKASAERRELRRDAVVRRETAAASVSKELTPKARALFAPVRALRELRQARAPWLAAIETRRKEIEGLQAQIGSEKRQLRDHYLELKGRVEGLSGQLRTFTEDPALKDVRAITTMGEDDIWRSPEFQKANKDIMARGRDILERAQAIRDAQSEPWMGRQKADRLHRDFQPIQRKFMEDRKTAILDYRDGARAKLDAAATVQRGLGANLAAAQKALADYEHQLLRKEDLPHSVGDGGGGLRRAQKDVGLLVDARLADQGRKSKIHQIQGRLSGAKQELNVWDSVVTSGGTPDAAAAAVAEHRAAAKARENIAHAPVQKKAPSQGPTLDQLAAAGKHVRRMGTPRFSADGSQLSPGTSQQSSRGPNSRPGPKPRFR